MLPSVSDRLLVLSDVRLNSGSKSLYSQDSQLVSGVAFKKTFSYAGFEMQPKRYDKPKIALLNVELELKAEKDNAEVRVKSVEVRVCFCVKTFRLLCLVFCAL